MEAAKSLGMRSFAWWGGALSCGGAGGPVADGQLSSAFGHGGFPARPLDVSGPDVVPP
ncbi:hypothetical protein [Actinocorallia libanotica]|uniref:hypothetical protein n=1 Tax=Actinocorallia libanotica TaxID=46162 RepID=UPI0031D1291E